MARAKSKSTGSSVVQLLGQPWFYIAVLGVLITLSSIDFEDDGGAGLAAADGGSAARRASDGAFTGEWATGFYTEHDVPHAGGGARHVRVHPNGGGGAGEGVSLDSDSALRSLGTVYNDRGQIVRRLSHVANGSALFRAPTQPGVHFQWPGVRVGHKQVVSGVSSPAGDVSLETLSMGGEGEPRVFYIHNFLGRNEAEKLVAFATDESNPYKMAPSTAATHHSWSEGGRKATSSQRTSENAFDMMTPTSFEVKRRGFRLLRLGQYEEAMADGIQILRYELGQAYIAHHDYFPTYQSQDHNWDPQRGGSNRWATIFLYLSDVEYGGQTVFPESPRLQNSSNAELVRRLGRAPSAAQKRKLVEGARLRESSWERGLIDRCYTRFAVAPRRGDAILFYSQKPDGRLDPASLHGACPVLKGTKWAANLWVWNACRFGQCRGDPLQPAAELGPKLKAPVAMP
eukprot:g5438.t1